MTCLIILLLASLWTAAWLHWVFSGEIRQFLFAFVFPKKWRGETSRDEMLTLDNDAPSGMTLFLAMQSAAPGFINGVLSCPGCLSAYISAAGTAVAFFAFQPSLFAVPLLWASSAWVGHRLYNHL